MARLAFLLFALLAACGGESNPPDGGDGDADADSDADGDGDADADGDADESDVLFEPGRVVEVEIEIAAADWDALRLQTRNLIDVLGGDCMDAPFESPFTWFPATVTVDGHRMENVGVRKKGFLGSLDPIKPSLKIGFDEFEPGMELFDQDGMTLNNARQDPSYLHQCLSYDVFDQAGVPAPRCNYAHVTVNGADLGLYVHVEKVGKRMLRRYFEDDGGNLYEGTLSDFRDGWVETFELKTNELENDRTDLDEVTAALDAPDGEVVTSLESVIDVDRFLTFWAAEVLLNHWDGYAGNTNNFFIYDDPTSGVFHFVPWGTDGTMVMVAPAIGGGVPGTPTSVFAGSAITRRLYAEGVMRDDYVARMEDLLDGAFDETYLLAEIDRMETLVGGVADPGGTGAHAQAVDGVREFVRERAEQILGELEGGPPEWTFPPRDPICFDPIGHVTGTFETTWGTIADPNPFATGTGTLDAEVNGDPVEVTLTGSKAGWDPNAVPEDPRAQVQIVVALPDGNFAGVLVNVRPQYFAPDSDLPVDWDIVFGAAFHFTTATGAFAVLGAFGSGTLHLDQASDTDGDDVTGSMDAELWAWPF